MVALVLAVLLAVGLPFSPFLLGSLQLRADKVTGLAVLFGGQTGLMLIALVLGVIAVVTERGRAFGIAAIVVAVLGNGLVLALVASLLGHA
ncbi:MAG: hypothetical protein QOE37_1539 [Microbacteriaceae bacterium]|nr:hypothetical protein [Microbacteriaceae bacterium]